MLKLEGADLTPWSQEAGGHRIQRVPPTEKRGRVHTSTVTVAVLDVPPRSQIQLQECDLEIQWFSGTGAGGQHRNKTQNSCRLIHKPTGVVAMASTRSRANSLDQARAVMIDRLQEQANLVNHSSRAQTRKDQVGSGMRGDKIRTIQFTHDQVVDHRTLKRITAEKYMRGFMNELWS